MWHNPFFHLCRRYTLALCRVRAKQTMDHVVRTLLERLVMLGIRLKLLLLDRGFYSVQVMRDLIMGELPFMVPLPLTVVTRTSAPLDVGMHVRDARAAWVASNEGVARDTTPVRAHSSNDP
jgi:hypothetical protein